MSSSSAPGATGGPGAWHRTTTLRHRVEGRYLAPPCGSAPDAWSRVPRRAWHRSTAAIHCQAPKVLSVHEFQPLAWRDRGLRCLAPYDHPAASRRGPVPGTGPAWKRERQDHRFGYNCDMRALILLPLVTLAGVVPGQTPRPDAPAAAFTFETQQIRDTFGVGYAVNVADVNGDRKPDILAISGTQLVWFENPSWTMHVALDGQTPKDNVTFAAHDIDRDGRLDVALGAAWNPKDTTGGGTLHWVSRAAGESWTLKDIASEPTLHRIRWANVDGTGDPELVVSPLHGRGTAPPEWNGVGPRILIMRVPKDPTREPWPVEVADDTLHILHNFAVLDFDGDRDDELLTASREGVHLLERSADGRWTKTRIGEGPAGEIKVGRVRGKRVLATIEPWHGNGLAIYREPATGAAKTLWARQQLDDTLAGGHAIGWLDVDGDGNDELAVGWRDKEGGVAIYDVERTDAAATRTMIDAGGMAAEDLTIADLNADGRLDIVASGRRTANVRIYWNRTERKGR